MSNQRVFQTSAATLLLIFCMKASADAGLPLIAVFLPPLWMALIPIILIEAIYTSRRLGISWNRSLVACGIANLVSTGAGIPLLWAFLAVIELIFFGTANGLDSTWSKLYAVTIQAPWLIPYEEDLWWMIPSALFVFAALSFGLSVAVEAVIIERLLQNQSKARVWRTVLGANILSYLFLGLIALIAIVLKLKLQTSLVTWSSLWEWLARIVYRIAESVGK